MEMHGYASPRGSFAETACGALLRELQHVWTEIGETDEEKDHMLLELEKECMAVYRRKVDEANDAKVRLRQSVAAKEAELAALMAALGEHIRYPQTDKRLAPLKAQLAAVTPLIEDLKLKREERMKQFADIKAQIDKINGEISGFIPMAESFVVNSADIDENDLSSRKLNECQMHLHNLQKEKSDRLHKVLECINEVHSLCGILGLDFGKVVSEVHPSLRETGLEQATNFSNDTLNGLAEAIHRLTVEKKERFQKLKETVSSLIDLWNLMDSPEDERSHFAGVSILHGSSEREITDSGILSTEMIDEVAAEVERLTKLKASRMKELVLKKRLELEEICRKAHTEPDMSTATDKINALIDSGIVDPSELLSSIEAQIVKAREESLRRKDILDRIDKWLAACEEENWLEEYNQDENRYSAGRGGHINLKRAEKARITVTKIPGMVDILMQKALAWERENGIPFLVDGVQLVSLLNEYKLTRQQKEAARREQRNQKKLQDLLLTEKEALYGSKPSPKRCNSLRKPNGIRPNGNGCMTPTPRRVSAGSATPELLTPRSYSGRQNGYFRETRRLSTAPLNFVAIQKEDAFSYASVCGSELGSPPYT